MAESPRSRRSPPASRSAAGQRADSDRRADSVQRAAAGRRAEDQALDHLRAHGLTLLARNFRCRGGEIDLVMQDAATLVFVEVRYRRSASFGDGAATVTRAKQRKLLHAARVFLARLASGEPACRFDVVSVSTPNYPLHWIKDAFTQDG